MDRIDAAGVGQRVPRHRHQSDDPLLSLVEDGCWYEADIPIFGPGEPLKTVAAGADYLDATAPVVRQRLKQAGVRLAHLLESGAWRGRASLTGGPGCSKRCGALSRR